MPDFTVDLDGLDALSKNLNRTSDNIDEATRKLDDLGPDSIGPDDLDEACATFRADWQEGLDKMREAIEELKGGLDAARKLYAEIDAAFEDGFQKMEANVANQSRGGGQ
ncbi:MAG: hypothetical protein ACRDQF_00685 [Thermocrispum sp.]